MRRLAVVVLGVGACTRPNPGFEGVEVTTASAGSDTSVEDTSGLGGLSATTSSTGSGGFEADGEGTGGEPTAGSDAQSEDGDATGGAGGQPGCGDGAPAFPGDFCFDAPFDVVVGGEPARPLTTGDVNGDGREDLVGARINGEPGFMILGPVRPDAAAQEFGPPTVEPAAIAVADFDLDGLLDVVVVEDSLSNSVQLWRNGNGSQSLSFGSAIGGVAVADFDLDGSLDCAFSSVETDRIDIAINNGSGGMSVGNEEIVADSLPAGLVAGDFDGDGVADIAAALAGEASVLVARNFGSGSGSFRQPRLFEVDVSDAEIAAIAAGDLNGDGLLDVVVTDSFNSTVAWMLGEGNGSLLDPQFAPVGQGPRKVRLGDLNNDRKLDIVVANELDKSVTVLLGDGAGGVEQERSFPLSDQPWGLAVDDLNGDGVADIAVSLLAIPAVTLVLSDP